jgi:hypothetical protein
MRGDNNGRWAGNYSWHLNHGSYLANVQDTIRRLRHYASLLFHGGCNECRAPRNSTLAPNPPSQNDEGIRRLLTRLDPGRFYISSSMGGVRLSLTSFCDAFQCFFICLTNAFFFGPNLTLCSGTKQIRLLIPSKLTIEVTPWRILTGLII